MDSNFVKNYKKNLRYIKENFPSTYERLMKRQEDQKYDISLKVKDSKLSILFDGEELFDEDYHTRLEDKTKKNITFLKKKVNDYGEMNINEGYWKDSLQLRSIEKIQYIAKEFQSEKAENKVLPLVVVYGAGTGYHIKKLLENFEILHLVIVDRDVELIRAIFYAEDFTELLKDTKLYITYGKNPEFIAKDIANIFHEYPLYVKMFEEYELYESDFFDEVKEELQKAKLSVTMSFGFFDDEIVSIVHTLQNSKKKPPFYRKKKSVPDDIPLFIVGSGPSLDKDLPTIKALQDRAIIFSCGTALKPLVDNGIFPDIEFILERLEAPYEALVDTLPPKELEKLTIIAVNHSYPKIYELGGNKWMVLRNSDCGSTFFPIDESNGLFNTTPTVTNLALSFALHVGFRTVYLFGVDLGFKDPKEHHAKDSLYYKKKKFEINEQSVYCEVEGNFGDTIATTELLYATKTSIERNIRIYKPKIFNCSDGAKVEGADPIHSSELELRPFDKSEALKILESNFDKDYFENFSMNDKLEKMKDDFEKLLQQAKRYIRDYESSKEALLSLEMLYEDIEAFKESNPPFYNLVKGTLYHLMTFIHFHLYSIGEEERRIAYLQESISHIYATIEDMKKIFDKKVLKIL